MTLTGKVTDEKNISIPFATVFISKNGALATPLARTLTDVNGNYTLNLGYTNYILNPPKFIPYGDSVTVKVSDINIPNQTKKIPIYLSISFETDLDKTLFNKLIEKKNLLNNIFICIIYQERKT